FLFKRFPCSFLTSSRGNSWDLETNGKPGVLKAACRGLSSSPETVWYLCRRSFTGNFSESCKAGDDHPHRAFPARRSTSDENDRFSQRPTPRCRYWRPAICHAHRRIAGRG